MISETSMSQSISQKASEPVADQENEDEPDEWFVHINILGTEYLSDGTSEGTKGSSVLAVQVCEAEDEPI